VQACLTPGQVHVSEGKHPHRRLAEPAYSCKRRCGHPLSLRSVGWREGEPTVLAPN